VIVDHPVTQAVEPAATAGNADRLPLVLRGAGPGDGLGDALRRVDLDARDQRAVSRIANLEALGAGGSVVRSGDVAASLAVALIAPDSTAAPVGARSPLLAGRGAGD
jgi:hypothetical protein